MIVLPNFNQLLSLEHYSLNGGSSMPYGFVYLQADTPTVFERYDGHVGAVPTHIMDLLGNTHEAALPAVVKDGITYVASLPVFARTMGEYETLKDEGYGYYEINPVDSGRQIRFDEIEPEWDDFPIPMWKL